MTRVPSLLPWLPWLVAIASCSTPPKPPTVDESRRRPLNAALEVELQTCRHELDNSRIVEREQRRRADAAVVHLGQQAQQQLATQERIERLIEREKSPAHSLATPAATAPNTVIPLHFAFGSSELAVTDADRSKLIAEARSAPLILLRGRTDGTAESPAESRIARQRAAAVADYLVRGGIAPERIRTTWQPVGDHAADNATPEGRSLNRRVEIEIYRQRPKWHDGAIAAASPPPQLPER
jgi:outer membrane protein OmpA-like peptidoglycan-associated protein